MNNNKNIYIYSDDDNNNNDMRLFWIQFKSVYQLGERVVFSRNVCCIQVFLFSSVVPNVSVLFRKLIHWSNSMLQIKDTE